MSSVNSALHSKTTPPLLGSGSVLPSMLQGYAWGE